MLTTLQVSFLMLPADVLQLLVVKEQAPDESGLRTTQEGPELQVKQEEEEEEASPLTDGM